MTLLQISVWLLLVIVNGSGVDSTRLTDEMSRKEANQRYDTLIRRISQLTAQSEINNSKMKERLSKIEVEQKERLSKIEVEQKERLSKIELEQKEQKELLKEQNELLKEQKDRFEQLEKYMEESRQERQCDAATPFSHITYQADISKLQNCTKNPYLVESEIIFQRRTSGRLSFNRGWEEYKYGFGAKDDEFWFGLEPLHQITSQGKYELHVAITYKGRTEYAQYSSFSIAGESDGYRLSLGPFVGGKAGDPMTGRHKGMEFSTPDRDNDLCTCFCGKKYKSGWWFKNCLRANLNGLWGGMNTWDAVIWYPMTDMNSASFTEMKIRRVI